MCAGGIPTSDSFQRWCDTQGWSSKLEVVTRDYIPLPKYEARRSEATPVSVRMLIIFKRSLDMTNATILLPNATPSRILYLHSLKFL